MTLHEILIDDNAPSNDLTDFNMKTQHEHERYSVSSVLTVYLTLAQVEHSTTFSGHTTEKDLYLVNKRADCKKDLKGQRQTLVAQYHSLKVSPICKQGTKFCRTVLTQMY